MGPQANPALASTLMSQNLNSVRGGSYKGVFRGITGDDYRVHEGGF